jgi:hypothetical protein
MTTKYNSFEEIDQRLRILKLQRKIYLENLKLNLNRARTGLSPIQLFNGFRGTLQQRALTFAIHQLSRIFGKSRHDKLLE